MRLVCALNISRSHAICGAVKRCVVAGKITYKTRLIIAAPVSPASTIVLIRRRGLSRMS